MTKFTQTSWLGGQMDVRMTGRQDMRNYRNGASVLKNFLPVKLGSIRKRPGTDYACDITDYVKGKEFRMIPFGFLSGRGFVIVIAADNDHCYMKAYNGTGVSQDFGGTAPYKPHELGEIGYVQCGDIVYLAHKNHPPAEIRHNENGSFTYSPVDFGSIGTKPVIGGIRVTRREYEDFYFSPKDQDLLDAFKSKADDWWSKDPQTGKYTDIYVRNYYGIYDNNKIYYPSTTVEYAASVVIDGSESSIVKSSTTYREPWTQSQVIQIPVSVAKPSGAKMVEIRLYKNAGGTYGLIGSHILGPNESSYTFRDDNIAPDTSETPMDDSDGVPFSTTDNYPGSVGLYQQRLVWAGTNEDPARIWMSRAGDLYEYRPHEKLRTDDAIDFILPITQFTNINFIVELGRLFTFAECTELVIGSASDSQGVSYETIMATEHSHLGCTKRLPPIVANNTLLFVNRTGQSVRDYDEKLGSSRFGGTDVSVFASGIFADNPIIDWTWQQEPNSTVWCVLSDGRLASFTYDKEQEIGAWAVHELGGGGKARGIAKTCAVFGRDAGRPTTGEVMVAVERDIGGWHRITLERMRPWAKGSVGSGLSYCVDMMKYVNKGNDIASLPWASLTYMNTDALKTAEEAAREGWFTHTPGVSVIANRPFVVFFPFESVMTTMPPVIGDQGGASQFDVKLGQHAHLRTVDSQGGEIYAVGMGKQPSSIDDGATRDGEDGATFRDVDVVLAGSNNRDGRVTVRHNEPWPFQLALLELDYEVEN